MKINKAYKFRIYPNENQIEIIEKSFGCTRFIYNHFLNQRNEIYKAEKRCMKYTEQQNQLPSMKKEFVWLKEVDSTSLQMSLRNLDTAFKNFLEGRADRPKFKSKRYNYKTYTSLHERISNQRLDFIHKLSKRIVSENQVIVLKDLAVKNMMKNDKLTQSISDVSWYKFVTMLDYKAKWCGRKLHKIDRWYPSSKTCSECGHVLEEISLHIREWKCPKCDSIHD